MSTEPVPAPPGRVARTDCEAAPPTWRPRPAASPSPIVIVIVFATVWSMVDHGYSSAAVAAVLSAACAASVRLAGRTTDRRRAVHA